MRDLAYIRAVAIARRVVERCQRASETGVEQTPMAGMFMPLYPSEEPKKLLVFAPTRSNDSARARMWEALDRLCGICGQAISDLADVTYDHVVPQSRGGGNYGNLVPAHSACNGAKADRMPTGCEKVMLAALNAKLGARLDVMAGFAAFPTTMREAFARAGAA
jgi:5-methylcytosine-specific restriction endonuclease McrA